MSSLDREVIERAREADLLAIARRLGATLRKSGAEFVGACLVCGGTDRFAININKNVWNCRVCRKGGDAIALVRHVTGCDFNDAVEQLIGGRISPLVQSCRRPRQRKHDLASDNNRAAAGRIWREAAPIFGTPAELYLACTRGIDLEQIPDIDGVLRFHPRCPFKPGHTEPCLIALVRDAVSNVPSSIIRTALTDDGLKIDRMALGPIGGGVIKLWSRAAVTRNLVIGEGLETVAAAATRIAHKGNKLQPAWATICAGNLAALPVLTGIEHLTILVDKDESGTGEDAANECTRNWIKAGRYVNQLIPHFTGTDFNDIALEDHEALQ
jgi:phage/plasmid primase-like uncharacterized protein